MGGWFLDRIPPFFHLDNPRTKENTKDSLLQNLNCTSAEDINLLYSIAYQYVCMYICVYVCVKQSGLSVDQWGKMASDRSKWRKLIHESIESFENRCIQYSAHKRLIRKGEQSPAAGPQSHHANWDIWGKLCLSLAGLKSHMRKCAKSILHPNNITENKTDRFCQFYGKISRSLAVLKSDLWTHTI